MTRIQDTLKTICERDDLQVAGDTPFRDLPGWDSMRAVTFQVELEATFSVDLSDAMIIGSSTLNGVAGILREKGVVLDPL